MEEKNHAKRGYTDFLKIILKKGKTIKQEYLARNIKKFLRILQSRQSVELQSPQNKKSRRKKRINNIKL